MKFKEFVDNINRAHDRGSFSLALVYVLITVVLGFFLIAIMVNSPVIGLAISFVLGLGRIVYAGLKGR